MKDILQPLFNQFMPFAQKRMGFNKPPRVFLRDDPENAQNPLGKTAYYDPEQMSVVLYTNGRHPKDIMRSLAHELVHHTQNCNGEFDNVGDMGEGYAQNDPHLREMERRAYEKGNLCFRDWEDSIKGTIYIQNLNVNIQKEGKLNMSTKDWKNRELPTLLTEKWGFSFNLLTESQEEEAVEEGVFKGRTGDPKDLPRSVASTTAAAEEEREEEKYINQLKAHFGSKWRDHYSPLKEEEVVEEGMCPACGKSPCCCPTMEEGEDNIDYRAMPEKCRPGEPEADSEECVRAAMMAQRVFGEGEELEEGGAALRDGNEDRLQQRHAHPDRIHEEEELDEEAKKMVKCGDKGMMPDYACDGKGQNDQREKMDEAQIRQLIRKLVKEAMNRKETK